MNSLLRKQWNYYQEKLREIGASNAMSISQFKKAIKIEEKPYLKELKDTGYKYGDYE